jgi:CRISPR type I-E-associated protein CasA/Cse1
MNVLTDRWVPVRLSNGSIIKISPAEVPTAGAVDVAHPRADYSALITEMLVCLFQTLAAPVDAVARKELLLELDTPDLLSDRNVVSLFELEGDGPRFLQAPAFKPKAYQSAASLNFEFPSENTLENNKDFFVSRECEAPLCSHCAPVALFLNQSHARMGGQGYRTGPRETSVMGAMLVGRDLWHTTRLNLLDAAWFGHRTAAASRPLSYSLPWTRPEVFTKKGSATLADIGLYGLLWWMPVALYLHFTDNPKQLPCTACGEVRDRVVSHIAKAATPVELVGDTPHPHTGWSINAKTQVGRCQEIDPRGFHLEQWQALTVGARLEDSLPAWQQLSWLDRDDVRLRVFGYHMNQMTPKHWVDSTAPVAVAANAQQADELRKMSALLLNQARSAQQALSAALRQPKHPNSQDPAIVLITTGDQAVVTFWSMVTPTAIETTRKMTNGGVQPHLLTEFQERLLNVTLRVFDHSVDVSVERPNVTASVLKRRRDLLKRLRPAAKKKAAAPMEMELQV